MPPEKSDAGWLWDMLDAAQAITQFVAGKTLDDYTGDRMLRGAVEQHIEIIEIIGEAARHVSTPFQEAHPAIAWRPIIAQRHILAHDYGEIRHDLIWRVATIHVPDLVALLQPLVPAAPSEIRHGTAPGEELTAGD